MTKEFRSIPFSNKTWLTSYHSECQHILNTIRIIKPQMGLDHKGVVDSSMKDEFTL